ncbi:hypothetical protein COCNU_08G000300 [Cocos nucifera]|uniref:Uncharacterized protein n=1 Tax=Cocos nucifera TaxID=13894 RepID=A0A8K0IGC2_COCNU|nr:hypothetical protein COCNU_08G000300 [Cocos nucifera]
MASSALSPPCLLPSLSSPRSRSHPDSRLSSLFRLSSPNPFPWHRRYLAIVSSSTTNAREAYASKETKKKILESYGLDPSDFILAPSRRSRRKRKDADKAGKGEQVYQPPEVLGGKARRKKLLSPKGMDVRPMMEVVRGAAFDILQGAGGCPASLKPGRWLDLYSGTGSVGIEAISRGCSEVLLEQSKVDI